MVLALLRLSLAYLIAAVFVFDFRTIAGTPDEDTFNGREVAIGPRPRLIFCHPSAQDGVNFSPRQWPFRVFAPVCLVWRKVTGFAPPAELRASKENTLQSESKMAQSWNLAVTVY